MILERIEYSTLERNETIKFVTDIGTFTGKIANSVGWFVSLDTEINTFIYRCINKDKKRDFNTFVESIVGYECSGMWPEVRTKEDLRRVLDALLRIGSDSNSGSDNCIHINKNKTIKLNFNL